MAFESDVFVSYAHIDDQTPVQGQTGWITALHQWLQVRLAQLLGKDPKIWRDAQLQGNELLARSIADRLPRVGVFVSVVSPRYVQSDWCKRELNEFVKASSGAGGETRVFKVVKTPVARTAEPPELQSMLGYEFYTLEPQSQRIRELGPLSPPEAMQQYWSRLDDLAHDIARLLSTLNGEAWSVSAPSHAPATNGVVYLAETSYDLNDRRDAIRRDLQSHGYTVLPDKPLPLVGSECVAAIRADLARARLSIHMVGNSYGVVPDGTTCSVSALQHDEALARAATGNFCRLIWVPPDLDTKDPRQQGFLKQLQTDSAIKGGGDLLKTPIEDFKTVVQLRLTTPEPTPGRQIANEGAKHVYVIADQRDREAVTPLQKLLYSSGFEVISSVFDGDEASIRRDHEESLTLCHAVLIYHGSASELWFRTKLRDLKKSAGYRASEPMLAKAVYLGPPLTPEKLAFQSHEVIVIREDRQLSNDLLAPFLKPLQ